MLASLFQWATLTLSTHLTACSTSSKKNPCKNVLPKRTLGRAIAINKHSFNVLEASLSVVSVTLKKILMIKKRKEKSIIDRRSPRWKLALHTHFLYNPSSNACFTENISSKTWQVTSAIAVSLSPYQYSRIINYKWRLLNLIHMPYLPLNSLKNTGGQVRVKKVQWALSKNPLNLVDLKDVFFASLHYNGNNVPFQ